MKINSINKNDFNKEVSFKSLNPLIAPLGAFYDANSIVPTLLIETGVTTGRSYEANKRGGKKEATERFVEQGTSALVWVYGVQILKKLGDFIGKNVFKIENLDFDLGKDILRNPVKNNKINSKAIGFKAGNILVSTAIATYFIGFILPKITHEISSKVSNKDNQNQNTNTKFLSFEEFKKQSEDNSSLAFNGLAKEVVSLAYTLENEAAKRLLITDTGVIAGRYKNARNKYEKIENLFRDITSIYFYLYCSKHVVNLLNTVSKGTNIDPKALKVIVEMLKENLVEGVDFQSLCMGINEDESFLELFKDKEIISVDEFIKHYPQYEQKALEMAKLQPIFDGRGVLTKMQAKDVLNDGIISNPKFLNDVMSAATNGKSNNKLKFVSKKHLENLRNQINSFVLMVDKYSKNKNQPVTKELIEKVANIHIIKNFAFNSIGLIVSAFALGILIPKVQYFITKKITNKNEFVGDMKDEK